MNLFLNILKIISSLNKSNQIPSFSLGEYYDFNDENNNNGYSADERDSNKRNYCDCLRINPILVKTEKCMKSLDQDSFNEKKKSKRSDDFHQTFGDKNDANWNNWRHSSSLKTLKSFKMDYVLEKENEAYKVYMYMYS